MGIFVCMEKFTFNKAERLKSKKTIGEIFSNGKVIGAHPVKLFWIEVQHNSELNIPTFQFAFTASKKKFKKAVDRNRIKRLMRESVRLNKHKLLELDEIKNKNFAFMFLYVGAELPNFNSVEQKINKCFDQFKITI